MSFDRAGNLWAAFELGIGRYDGNKWIILKPFPDDSSGANPANYATAVIEDSKGNIWAAINNHGRTYACMFDGTKWTTTFLTALVPANAILELESGDIWFGSAGGGAYIFNGTNWTKSNCNGNCYAVYSIYKDKDGSIWIGRGDSKISKYDGNSYTSITVPYSGGDVVDIIKSRAGELYASLSPGGAWKLAGNEWQKVLDSTHPTGPVLSMLEDSKGRLWIGTMGKGLYEIEGQKITLHYLNGNNSYITKILEDAKGVLWLSNSFGLWKYE